MTAERARNAASASLSRFSLLFHFPSLHIKPVSHRTAPQSSYQATQRRVTLEPPADLLLPQMATSLAPAPARAAYTPSTVAPLSAAAKAFRNPDFSLECRKPDKVALIPAPISQQQWSPPDEEKGRSIRSPGSRSNSTASLELGDRSLDSNGSATDVESLLDDDPFLDGWLEDRKASGVPGGASEGPFGPTAVERAAPWSELERPQAPRGVDWTRVLATAIETAKETLDLRWAFNELLKVQS